MSEIREKKSTPNKQGQPPTNNSKSQKPRDPQRQQPTSNRPCLSKLGYGIVPKKRRKPITKDKK
eukprot:scaffold18340_cov53-Attheya_sp.AAC.3